MTFYYHSAVAAHPFLKRVIYSSHYFCTFFVAQKKQINHLMKNSGSGKSKNPSWSKSPIKPSLFRVEIKKLLRILDPQITFCKVNVPIFQRILQVEIIKRNAKMARRNYSKAWSSTYLLQFVWASKKRVRNYFRLNCCLSAPLLGMC